MVLRFRGKNGKTYTVMDNNGRQYSLRDVNDHRSIIVRSKEFVEKNFTNSYGEETEITGIKKKQR
jgi:hypothetical protein